LITGNRWVWYKLGNSILYVLVPKKKRILYVLKKCRKKAAQMTGGYEASRLGHLFDVETRTTE
jgi:hypothetical protein